MAKGTSGYLKRKEKTKKELDEALQTKKRRKKRKTTAVAKKRKPKGKPTRRRA